MAKVTVYTKNGCVACNFTKQTLEAEGIEFEAINIQETPTIKVDGVDKDAIEYLRDELGFSSMPVVVAEGLEPFAGFQPDKIEELKGL